MSLAEDVIDSAPGVVFEYSGINLPPGYLWANGAAVSRTSYARLFAALSISVSGVIASGSTTITSLSQDLTALPTSLVGAPVSGPGIPAGATITAVTSGSITLSAAPTTSTSNATIVIAPHGVGDGSTTFNVPDRRGRAAVGHDLMGATSAAGRLTAGGSGMNGTLLGASGGAEVHVLSIAEIPTHTHANTLTDNGHTHANSLHDPAHSHANSLSDPGHAHSYPGVTMVQNGGLPFDLGGNGSGGSSGGSNTYAAGTGMSINNAGASTGITLTNVGSTTGISITNASQGSGSAHTNVQPSLVMNYIIKT
jgi:microcystin-dependent protein